VAHYGEVMARALITGCSTGIGRATAVELTKRGYEVVATARRPETLDDLDVAVRLALDVDDDASVTAAVDAAGPVDVLVNNAGWGLSGPVESVPIDEVRRLYETNFFGALRMIQAVVPGMRERGAGAVVNVSSVNGRVSSPFAGFYASTKYALEALSEALHYEAGHYGIRVVLIEPGSIRTNIQENSKEIGVEAGPYEELSRQFTDANTRLTGGEPAGPELVATVIAEALEADPPKLRWPVGADADLVLSARSSMDDEAFEAAMRQALDITW
jgi:NAD(P)-dependent dehydrogenase (short-subunit alcohol dehydrogenase family)